MVMKKNVKKFAAFTLAISLSGMIGVDKTVNAGDGRSDRENVWYNLAYLDYLDGLRLVDTAITGLANATKYNRLEQRQACERLQSALQQQWQAWRAWRAVKSAPKREEQLPLQAKLEREYERMNRWLQFPTQEEIDSVIKSGIEIDLENIKSEIKEINLAIESEIKKLPAWRDLQNELKKVLRWQEERLRKSEP